MAIAERMDNRVRDLDQIQEDDSDDRARSLGTILLGTAAIVGLTLAVGVVVSRAAEPAAKLDDPLAKLEHPVSQAGPTNRAATAEPAAPTVEPSKMTFPSTLADDEDRPEVVAALKAAAAEEAALAPAPAPGAAQPQATDAPAVTPPKSATAAQDDDDDDVEGDTEVKPAKSAALIEAKDAKLSSEEMVARIPAAVAAGTSARSLRKVVEHDPMVAAAIRAEPAKNVATAPHGHEGEFTLQVISYDRPEPSRAFADGLRAKGHMAFVVAADVPDRGRYFRVRVGPFKTREQAEAYRHKFEDDEHMNTFVVRDKDEAGKR